MATETLHSGVPQPTASMPWIITGDFNTRKATMMKWCQPFVKPNVQCISDSGWPDDSDAQTADFALSQGIALQQVKSWVGWHSKPCASDVHDAVVVMGSLDLQQLHRQDKPSGWNKPGIALFKMSSSTETITAADEEVTEPQPKTMPKRLAEPQATTAASPSPPATAATATAPAAASPTPPVAEQNPPTTASDNTHRAASVAQTKPMASKTPATTAAPATAATTAMQAAPLDNTQQAAGAATTSSSDDTHLSSQLEPRTKRPHRETITTLDEEVTEPQAKRIASNTPATTAAPATAATTAMQSAPLDNTQQAATAATTTSSSDDTHLAESVERTLDRISTIAQMDDNEAATTTLPAITKNM